MLIGMSKRLQVLLPEKQYEELRRIASSEGVTVAAWVRRVLEEAAREKPYRRVEEKLAAVREAAAHEYPTADIDDMLREVAAGRDVDA